jgi:fucose permease
MDAFNHMQIAVRARWAVATIFLVNGFIVGSWAPQIPLVLTRLSINEATLGLLILCFGVGALVSMPWAGWLMGRFGERPVLATVGFLQGMGLLLVVLSPTVPVTAVTMVIFGALVGCTDVAMNAATVTVERRMGRAIMSSMHGFWSLGGFVGGGLGGLLIQQLGTSGHALLVAVVALAAVTPMLPRLLPSERAAVIDPAGKRGGGFSIPRTPLAYALGMLALILFAGEGVVLDWAALYMGQELGANLTTAALPYAFFAGGMALMRFLGDGVRNRFGAVTTLRVCCLVAAASMAAAGLAPTPILAIIAFAVCGLAVANTVPIIFSAAGNIAGMSSGAGISVATTMGYSGILMAPSVIGFVAATTGFRPVFIAFALLIALVGICANLARSADYDHGSARAH